MHGLCCKLGLCGSIMVLTCHRGAGPADPICTALQYERPNCAVRGNSLGMRIRYAECTGTYKVRIPSSSCFVSCRRLGHHAGSKVQHCNSVNCRTGLDPPYLIQVLRVPVPRRVSVWCSYGMRPRFGQKSTAFTTQADHGSVPVMLSMPLLVCCCRLGEAGHDKICLYDSKTLAKGVPRYQGV